MDIARAHRNLAKINPRHLTGVAFVKAYNTKVKTEFLRDDFFDCTWSYTRGFRYNFKGTLPVLYLAEDSLTASSEIGAKTRLELLVPHLNPAEDPYLYVTVKVTADVLDLTDKATRRMLGGVSLKELLLTTDEWQRDMNRGRRSVTHRIGALAASDARFDGILYPSFPSRKLLKLRTKECVAIFMEKSSPTMAQPRNPAVKLVVSDTHGILNQLGIQV